MGVWNSSKHTVQDIIPVFRLRSLTKTGEKVHLNFYKEILADFVQNVAKKQKEKKILKLH